MRVRGGCPWAEMKCPDPDSRSRIGSRPPYNLGVPTVTTEIPHELSRQIDRIIRDGWYPDQETVLREALAQFVDAKTFLGDSPRMLHRFAADALNDSKPDVALKFVTRGLSILSHQKMTDFTLYQALAELRVQILLVLERAGEALAAAEEAREMLPNSPAIARWIEKLSVKRN
jgi:Arc/MetJ-type ribon-helix-helix transcriptional regulator